jgi:uncharacterized protein
MEIFKDPGGRTFMWTLVAGAAIAITLVVLFIQYFIEYPISYDAMFVDNYAFFEAASAQQQSGPTFDVRSIGSNESDIWKSFRIVSSGPTDPVWNAVGERLRLLLKADVNGSAVDSLPGSAVINIKKITASPSEAECGLTLSFLAKAAVEGAEPFDRNATSIGGVANLYEQGLHFIVNPNATIDSVSDIEGKNITLSTGPEGDIDDLLTGWLLSEYGTSYGDIESSGGVVEHNFFDLALMKLADGSVDAISYLAPISSMELKQFFGENKGLKLLSMNEEVVDRLSSNRSLSGTVIPAGTYEGVTSNVTTAGSNSILVCGSQLPNNIVGNVSRVMIDNLGNFTAERPEMTALSPESAPKDVGITLHPGAKAYYESINALEP